MKKRTRASAEEAIAQLAAMPPEARGAQVKADHEAMRDECTKTMMDSLHRARVEGYVGGTYGNVDAEMLAAVLLSVERAILVKHAKALRSMYRAALVALQLPGMESKKGEWPFGGFEVLNEIAPPGGGHFVSFDDFESVLLRRMLVWMSEGIGRKRLVHRLNRSMSVAPLGKYRARNDIEAVRAAVEHVLERRAAVDLKGRVLLDKDGAIEAITGAMRAVGIGVKFRRAPFDYPKKAARKRGADKK